MNMLKPVKGVNNYVPPPSQQYLLIEEFHFYVSNFQIFLFHNELEILFAVTCDCIYKFYLLLATFNHYGLRLLDQNLASTRNINTNKFQDLDVLNRFPQTNGPFNFF